MTSRSSLDSDLFVTLDHRGVHLRRAVDGQQIREIGLPTEPGAALPQVRLSRFRPAGAVLDVASNRIGFIDLVRATVEWQSLPNPAPRFIEDVQGDGEAVVLRYETGFGYVARGARAPATFERRLVAVAAEADGLVVAEADEGESVATVRRIRIDASGVSSGPDLLSYDSGSTYPTLLGLAPVGESEFVTLVLPKIPDGEPPQVVIQGPERAPRTISRAWFRPDQAIVRDNQLFHFEPFGSRELQRLALSEGASVAPVFEDEVNVVALRANGTLALCRTAETVVIDGSRVAFVYEMRDVDTGAIVARPIVEAREVVLSWMVDAASVDA